MTGTRASARSAVALLGVLAVAVNLRAALAGYPPLLEGALLVPLPPVIGPWAWAALMGIGVGAGFPSGLTAIAWRAADAHIAAATSGLALGIGYTTAGLGPVLMGVLIDLTGGYTVAIALLLLAGLVQALSIVVIGDP